MSEEIGWRFPHLDGGNQQGYSNNDIEAFKDNRINSLVRETCQNSLDARREDAEGPVKVVYELRYLPSSLEAFTQYSDCLNGCEKYWREKIAPRLKNFLETARNMLDREEIPTLIVSDYNTEGLTGSRSLEKTTPWKSLTESDGISDKSSEVSGGSFGIGKNAAFACTSLSMVFYNTFASDDEKAFMGEAKLATLEDENGEPTQGTGKYQVVSAGCKHMTPVYRENRCAFRDLFLRSELGTDIIIAGFNQTDSWEEEVEKAALKNFFVAIQEGMLSVEIKGEKGIRSIGQETISEVISQYASTEVDEMAQTVQLYAAFTNPDAKAKYKVLADDEDDDVEFFVKKNANNVRYGAQFQRTGMFISPYTPDALQEGAAVLLVRGEGLAKILRAAEPPAHNRWTADCIDSTLPENQKTIKDVNRAINKMRRLFREFLAEQFKLSSAGAVDAVGVATYLPDEEANDDPLRPQRKISVAKSYSRRRRGQTSSGMKGAGAITEGSINNSVQNPEAPAYEQPTQVVDPNIAGEDTEGIVEGPGTKSITRLDSYDHRAISIDDSQGLYRIIVEPYESLSNAYITFSVRGEDEKIEDLDLESLACNGNYVHVRGNQAGPLNLLKGTPATLIAKFTRKEKMMLRLGIAEEAES